ncbi:RHS repeat domain-containing protein [Paenibacillus sp. 481]|uniref:RHS repeat domain-containing protein n=1 Tax=Paenibacillus sp. 481 TaxID=2835869 RepID=UPI001E4D15F6|nr:RHS repeat-associated core domain-containing protein [Paenibacillus sp. 481]UHA74524.1 hypothetical protein KIK04_05335 [Paenibacillus sp. 481]
MTAVIDADGKKVSYTYNLAGDLVQIQYADGTVLKKKYDEIGRLIEQIDPKNLSKRFYHDANNNLVKSIDRKGQVHQFGYSSRNFLTSSTTPIPEEGVTYAYDEGGNRIAMTDATGTTRYAYFPTGELRTITYPDQTTLSYEYEARSLRTKQTVTTPTFSSSMTVNYGTMFSHPTSLQVTDRNNMALATMNYTYDKSETNLAKLSMSNGITETYTYDGLNLAHIQQHQGATPFGQYQYSYDPNRNITSKNENGTPFTFTYDKLNRVQTNSQFSETYTYDARDNRSTLTTANPPVQKGAQYSYDSRNRLTRAVTEDGNIVTYRYNGDGLMVERSQAGETTRYYYDDRKIIVAEGKVEPSGTVTITYAYAHDPKGRLLARQVASTNQMQYYVTNGHGDVTEIRDSQGTVLNKYTYDIWGKPLVTDKEQVPNIFRYSGEYWDSATNLQYLRSRWYDPNIGRFTTEDTYEGEIKNLLSLNLYTYVANNPLKYIDPSGHRFLSAQLAELEFVIDHAMELTSKGDPEYWANRQYLGVKFQPIFNDNNNNQFKYLFGQLTKTSTYENSVDNAGWAKNQLLDAYDQWQYGPLMAAAAGSMGSIGGMGSIKRTNSVLQNTRGLDDILNDPGKLKGVKPADLHKSLKDNGYNPQPLSGGSLKGKAFESGGGFKIVWGGDRILQYHPGSRHHGGVPYWKLSSGKTGTNRYDMKGKKIK